MTVKQISVFVENKPGVLVKIMKTLGDAGIDIRALSVADTQDFGILRMIVSDNAKAKEVLASIGCVTSITDVIAAQVPNTPGATTEMIALLADHALNIEYMYAFLSSKDNRAYIVLRIKDTEKAISVLSSAGIIMADEIL